MLQKKLDKLSPSLTFGIRNQARARSPGLLIAALSDPLSRKDWNPNKTTNVNTRAYKTIGATVC
jgi:hypothetical protein